MTYGSDITELFVLLASTRHGHEEHKNPRDTNLEPHFQVNGPKARVEACSHKHVIDEVTRHTNLVAGGDCEEIHPERDTESDDHGDSHEMSEVVDNSSETEDARVVEDGGGDPGDVNAAQGVALVDKGLVSERGYRQTLLHVAGHPPSEEELVQDETAIDFPRVPVRARVLVNG